MTTDLHDQVRATFDEIVAHTPGIGPAPSFAVHTDAMPAPRRSRPWLVSAAASAVVIAASGVLWVLTTRDGSATREGSASPASAPLVAAATTVPLEPITAASTAPALEPAMTMPVTIRALPGGPTLFPVLDSPESGPGLPWGVLHYDGVYAKPQTNAVVARVESDGTMNELYTFVAGEGVAGYTDGVDISTEASTPLVARSSGSGYAGWNVAGVPILVVAADPLALLDDPAFSLGVGTDDRGGALLEFESLPAGFEVLVAPRQFARQAASARLIVGEGVPSIRASLDHPLTNLNLTQGMTITPAQVNEHDAWIVSGAETDHMTVVFSPDGTTWVLLGSGDGQTDLLALAGEIEFIPADDVGTWMTLYDVALPAVPFDEPASFG